jgi:curved DNA-binding protein
VIELQEAIQGAERTLTLSPLNGGDPQTVRVKIPKGTKDGDKLKVAGKGQPGMMGGPAGDLLLVVQVKPHPRLRRTGDDLEMDLPVTLAEAWFGGKVQVPTLDGPITMTVPPRTRSGARLRARGRGVTNRKGERGDLYFQVLVQLPSGEGPELDEAVRSLASHYSSDVRGDLKL